MCVYVLLLVIPFINDKAEVGLRSHQLFHLTPALAQNWLKYRYGVPMQIRFPARNVTDSGPGCKRILASNQPTMRRITT